jgi:hypothetical protein
LHVQLALGDRTRPPRIKNCGARVWNESRWRCCWAGPVLAVTVNSDLQSAQETPLSQCSPWLAARRPSAASGTRFRGIIELKARHITYTVVLYRARHTNFPCCHVSRCGLRVVRQRRGGTPGRVILKRRGQYRADCGWCASRHGCNRCRRQLINWSQACTCGERRCCPRPRRAITWRRAA